MAISPAESNALKAIVSALASSPQAWIFLEVPDRKLYPDYYMFIKEPMSLNQIQKSLQKGVYPAAQLVAYDLFLVWANARQYNQEGSDIFNNSVQLEHQMKSLWKQNHPPLPKFKHLVMKPDNWSDPAGRSGGGGGGEEKPKKKKLKLADNSPPPPPPQAQQQMYQQQYHQHQQYQSQPSTSHTPAPTRITLGGASASALGTPQAQHSATPTMPKLKFNLGGTPAASPAASATPPPPQHHTPAAAPLKLKLGGQSVAASPAQSPAPQQQQQQYQHSTPTTINPSQLLSRPPQQQQQPHPAPPTIPRFSVPPRPQQPQIPRVSVPPRPQPPAMPAGSRAPHVGHLFGRPAMATPTRPPPPQPQPHPQVEHKPVITPVAHVSSPATPAPPTPASHVAPSPAPSTPAATPSATPGVINVPPPPPAGVEPKVPKERKAERKARQKAERKAAKEAEAAAARAAKAAGLPPPSKGTPGPGAEIKREGAPDVDPGWMQDVAGGPEVAKVRYLDILNKLQQLKDHTGRQLAAPLVSLPNREQRPDYYSLVPNPVAIESIQAKVVQGVYPNATAFDHDLRALFDIAKLFINKSSPGPLYTDLLVLQRFYHSLTKRQSTPPPNSAAPIDRGTVESRVFLNGVNLKGNVLRVGDFIHLMNPSELAQPTIAQIFKLFTQPNSPQRSMTVCLYARPEGTSHPTERTFLPTEVFKTGTFEDHDVEEFIEKVAVQYVDKWVIGRPKWFNSSTMSSYVCENRYKHEDRVFKRIKNWTSCLPDEVRAYEDELELLPEQQRIAPASIVKLPSPFKIDPATGLNAIKQREQNQAKADYSFHDNGEPANADEVKQAKARYAVELREQEIKMREEALKAARERAAVAAAAGSSAAAAAAATGAGATGATANGVNGGAPRAGGWNSQNRLVSTAKEQKKEDALTPAEVILAKESFKPLPEAIARKFTRDGEKDVLWFTTPSQLPTAQETELAAPVVHSLEYLYWRAMQLKEDRVGVSAMEGVVAV